MKVDLVTKSFTDAVAMAAKATQKKNVMPILACVLVSRDDASIRVTGTDLMTRVTVRLPDTGGEAFQFAVDAERFLKVLESLRDDELHLEIAANAVNLRCGGIKSKFPTVPAEDFPKPELPTVTLATLTPDVLFNVSKYLAPFVSNSDAVTVISGINVTPQEKETMFYGADGYRASRLRVPTVFRDSPDGGYNIPATAVNLAAKLMAGEEVGVLGGGNNIAFCTPNVMLYVSLIAGKYPDMDKLVGDGLYTPWVEFKAEDMLAALGSIAPFCERTTAVSFKFTAHDAVMSVDTETGGTTARIKCESKEPLDFLMQFGVVTEALASIHSNDAVLSVNGPAMRFSGKNNNDYVHVAMTMRPSIKPEK